ncbi:MAG: hypothetical protein WCV80_00350 [Candidatus Paceibacterota bacterium]|jgi:hypothetical protein
MKRVQKAIANVLHRLRGSTLLVEQINGVYKISRAYDAETNRSAHIIKQKFVRNLNELRPSLFGLRMFGSIILALDSHHATTIESGVKLVRANPQEPIDEGELDALLFHGFWNFLNRYRAFASKKLGINELDLIVANVAVNGVRIGTHTVFNPLDFSGRELFLKFRGTLIARDFLPSITHLSKFVRGNIIVVERGSILMEAIGEPVVFLEIEDEKTSVFVIGNEESSYVGECAWGAKNITRALGKLFGVHMHIVPALLNRYTNNQISEKMRHIIVRTAREEMRNLIEHLEPIVPAGHMKKSAIRYVLSSSHPIPESLFACGELRSASFKIPKNVSLGVKRELNESEEEGTHIDQSLALFAFPYLHPQYMPVNQLLQRRVKWLMPHA